MKPGPLALALGTLLACSASQAPSGPAPLANPRLIAQSSGTTALLQAVSVVNERAVWVSGHRGTWARTIDGGVTWMTGRVPGADTLQFRDVEAVDAATAYLMSAGNGPLSRIYKTTDAGRSWTLQFTNIEPKGFFDCMSFWDADHGLAFSDSFDGHFYAVETADGGAHWTVVPPGRFPASLPDEGAFAASGTCLATHGRSRAWIATGATGTPRVLRTVDGGRSWQAALVPIPGGPTAGLTSISFRDAHHGVVFGGDVAKADLAAENVLRTTDGGVTWRIAARAPLAGAVFAGVYLPTTNALLAAGPGGLAYSPDEGTAWVRFDTLAYWSVGAASPRAAWAVGPGGRITAISFGPTGGH